MKPIQALLLAVVLCSCGNTRDTRTEMLQGLRSCNKDSICVASFYFGEQRDTLVVADLLRGINDNRISHDVRHKGMSVYYCKMGALRKISGLAIQVEQTEEPDTAKINLYIDWALKYGLIKSAQDIDTTPCVR